MKIVAIEGSYRSGGTTEHAVAAILAGAREQGAETEFIHLREQHLAFCTNCRECTQLPGPERGKCIHNDALEEILTRVEAADAIVLASPVNFFNLTALFRGFLERLLGYVYWPWGQKAPKPRTPRTPRRAVLVASTAMPGFLIPIATGAPRALQIAARMMGAKTIGKLWIGLVSDKPRQQLSSRVERRARKLGARLARA